MASEDDDDHLPDSLIPESTQIAPGTQIIGTYEIEEHLNTGGMGEVYRGHNIHTDEPVAIKIVLPALAHDRKIISLFQKEATVLNRLNHEAIVRYQIFTVDPGIKRPCLVMEFVGGESLADHMRNGPMPTDQVFTLLARVASGLGAAHKLGVIHRDLSPDNVILQDGLVEHAKIIDFGIAKAANVGSGRTLIGDAFAGKFGFVAPEQLGKYGREVTDRTDIYSLGLMIAAACRGEAIDMGDDFFDALEARNGVPDLSGIDPAIVPLLERLLQPDPKDRPADMNEVLAMLPGAEGQTQPPTTYAPTTAAPATQPPAPSAPPVSQAPASTPPQPTQVSEAPNAQGTGPGQISQVPGGGFEATRISELPQQPTPRAPDPTQISQPPASRTSDPTVISASPTSPPGEGHSASPTANPSATQIWGAMDTSTPPVSEPPAPRPPVSEHPVSEAPVSQPPASTPPVSEVPHSVPPAATPVSQAPGRTVIASPAGTAAPERTQIASAPPVSEAPVSQPPADLPEDSDSPFGPPPTTATTAPKTAPAPAPEPARPSVTAAPAKKSNTGVLVSGGVAALVLIGAGAWFGGLVGGGSAPAPQPSTQVAAKAPAPASAPSPEPTSAPAAKPEPPAVTLPAPLSRPKGLAKLDLASAAPAAPDPAARRAALLAEFDALGCALAVPQTGSGAILTYAAAGRDVATLKWALARIEGSAAPKITPRMVSPAQCPALALAANLQAGATGAAAPSLSFDASSLTPGQPLVGHVTGAGDRKVTLLMVDPAGGVYDLSDRLSAGKDGARKLDLTLSTQAGATAGQPLLFLALASDTSLKLPSGEGAAKALPALLDRIRSQKANAAAVIHLLPLAGS